MRILIVKLSSMGDVVHTLPGISDIIRNFPQAQIDWVVEKSFSEIPQLHPAIRRVIPVEIRKWRENWWQSLPQVWSAIRALRQTKYDLILDPQGLLKSVLIAKLARGPIHGYMRHSIRSSGISWVYQKQIKVSKDIHAIDRIRSLFAQSLGYKYDSNEVDYGIRLVAEPREKNAADYVVFLPATTWNSKHWPEKYWQMLGNLVADKWNIKISAGTATELTMIQGIAAGIESKNLELIHGHNLIELAKILQNARAVIGVDTGLIHLANALNVPTIGIFGATDAQLSGCRGVNQHNLQTVFPCSPCFKRHCQYNSSYHHTYPACYSSINPKTIWKLLSQII